MLTVVRSSEEPRTDVTYPPVHEGVSNSPFKGLTEVECYHTLCRIYRDAGSELRQYYFVIMDEQSVANHTVTLCGWDGGEEDYVHTMRVDFKLGNSQAAALSTGHMGFEDTDY